MTDLPDPVLWAVPLFIVSVAIEWVWARRGGPVRYDTRDALASLAMGSGNLVSNVLLGGAAVAASLWVAEHAVFDFGWAWWLWPICFVVDDFAYYWFHRSAHRVRWFWASHVVHHSSQHYNLTTALRQTWTGVISLSFVFRLPLFWIGFPPEMIFFCVGLNLIYQYWIHTEAVDRCPAWFEAIFNTPSHHRVHHATNPRYLDANYAGVFIIWDKLFGSFVPERADDPCRYGLVHNISSHNPLVIATHEWGAMARDLLRYRPRHWLGFLFGPPGWSPDGSRDTSDKLKAAWRAEQGGSE
jgi:sterol desaturase/sphingolipid hydroxylase (fatty acid hydroxylase superfamily)